MIGVVETGTPAYSRRISRVTPHSPQNARAWARTLLTGLGYDPSLAELAVSEFITNVLRYAAGSALIALALTDDGIEVSCSDMHPETAGSVRPSGFDDETVSGRGLFILAALATDGIHVAVSHSRKSVAVRLPIGDAS